MKLPCGCDHSLADCLCHCEDCQEEDSNVCFKFLDNGRICPGGYFCPHKEEYDDEQSAEKK